jgi:hypothetical protein
MIGGGPLKPGSPSAWRLATVGTELAGAVAGGTLLGYWIDWHFGTGPWGLVTGASVGIVGGLYNLVRRAVYENLSSTARTSVRSVTRQTVTVSPAIQVRGRRAMSCNADSGRRLWAEVLFAPLATSLLISMIGWWPTAHLAGRGGLEAMLLAQALLLVIVYRTLSADTQQNGPRRTMPSDCEWGFWPAGRDSWRFCWLRRRLPGSNLSIERLLWFG